MPLEIRVLKQGDEQALEAFLLPRLETSLFMVGNMRQVGLVDGGRRFEGTYVAAFEGGNIVGAAVHYWNGNVIVQAPVHVQVLVRAAVNASGRLFRGLIGPGNQVKMAISKLGLAEADYRLNNTEWLYKLKLDKLIVPEALNRGQVRGRRIRPEDVELVTGWMVGFALESLGEKESPALWKTTRANVENRMKRGSTWLLLAQDEPVSSTSFNVAIREVVQIGGVWTPPEYRSHGYARAAVAASLLDARSEGAEEAILFTDEDNFPAQKAYTALGFQRIGDYQLAFLQEPVTL